MSPPGPAHIPAPPMSSLPRIGLASPTSQPGSACVQPLPPIPAWSCPCPGPAHISAPTPVPGHPSPALPASPPTLLPWARSLPSRGGLSGFWNSSSRHPRVLSLNLTQASGLTSLYRDGLPCPPWLTRTAPHYPLALSVLTAPRRLLGCPH